MQIKSKKGDIPVEFLVSFILAIMLFWGAYMILANFLNTNDRYISSFENLRNEITNVFNEKKPDVESSVVLKMKKESLIAFFGSDVDLLKRDESTHTRNIGASFLRPIRCKLGESCLCLCLSIDHEWFQKPKYDLEKACKTLLRCDIVQFNLLRTKDYQNGVVIETVDNFQTFEEDSTLQKDVLTRAVYIQKKNQEIKLCYDPPCFRE